MLGLSNPICEKNMNMFFKKLTAEIFTQYAMLDSEQQRP